MTGTLTINRRGLPKAIKGRASLSRGSTRAFKSGRLLVLQWRDKRVITALSTQHGSNQVEVNLSLHFNHSIHTKAHYLYSATRYIQLTYTCFFLQVINRRRQTVKKPAIIADYNKHKLSVDKCDQLLSYYSFLHKSVKWW